MVRRPVLFRQLGREELVPRPLVVARGRRALLSTVARAVCPCWFSTNLLDRSGGSAGAGSVATRRLEAGAIFEPGHLLGQDRYSARWTALGGHLGVHRPLPSRAPEETGRAALGRNGDRSVDSRYRVVDPEQLQPEHVALQHRGRTHTDRDRRHGTQSPVLPVSAARVASHAIRWTTLVQHLPLAADLAYVRRGPGDGLRRTPSVPAESVHGLSLRCSQLLLDRAPDDQDRPSHRHARNERPGRGEPGTVQGLALRYLRCDRSQSLSFEAVNLLLIKR